jgi:serine/threonine protein kinase
MFLLMCQEPPFWHENHKQLFEDIKTDSPYWEDHRYLSVNASSLLHGLLEKDPEKRLGVADIQDLKDHPFFDGVDWAKALQKEGKPPFLPAKSERKLSVCIPVSWNLSKPL